MGSLVAIDGRVDRQYQTGALHLSGELRILNTYLYVSYRFIVMTANSGILQGHEMDDEEIAEFLVTQGVGVLSMENDGIPYGIPLSFGYAGDKRVYLLFAGYSEEGRKVTYAERSETVSFLVYDIYSDDAWRSVIIEGTLDRITHDEWETAREAMGDNAFKPDLLTSVNRREDPRVWALDIDEWSGRKSDTR